MKFTILIEGFIAFSKYAFSINSVLGEVKMKILKTSYALKLHVHVYDHFDPVLEQKPLPRGHKIHNFCRLVKI